MSFDLDYSDIQKRLVSYLRSNSYATRRELIELFDFQHQEKTIDRELRNMELSGVLCYSPRHRVFYLAQLVPVRSFR